MSLWRQLVETLKAMRGLPDLIAWRLDTWTTAMRDLQDPRVLPWEVLR